MLKQSVLLALTALAMSSCATITSGTHQTVNVKTSGTEGAYCTLKNNKGKWTIKHTPGSVTVDRSGEDLNVYCSKSGHAKNKAVTSHLNGAMIGNLILPGGTIGMIVDRANGSAFSYPNEITIPLRG